MNVSQSALVTLAKAAKRIKEIREAERLEDSFYEFVKAAWHVFDPADFVGNYLMILAEESFVEDPDAPVEKYVPGRKRLVIDAALDR